MKLSLVVEYVGNAFSGWQSQPGVMTVQGELERALSVYLNSLAKRLGKSPPHAPVVVGSGRTDAGVHARGQVCSFTWPSTLPLESPRLQLALNAITVPELVIRQVSEVDDAFDARLSPHVKCYSYRFLLRRGPEGMFFDRAWAIDPAVNIAAMARAARVLRGKHDFQSFRAADCTAKTTERTILVSEISRVSDEELLYVVHGTGFLKQMVRIVVGTLVEIGLGRREPNGIEELLHARDRALAGMTAPARGLTLEWVRYLDRPYYNDDETTDEAA